MLYSKQNKNRLKLPKNQSKKTKLCAKKWLNKNIKDIQRSTSFSEGLKNRLITSQVEMLDLLYIN